MSADFPHAKIPLTQINKITLYIYMYDDDKDTNYVAHDSDMLAIMNFMIHKESKNKTPTLQTLKLNLPWKTTESVC